MRSLRYLAAATVLIVGIACSKHEQVAPATTSVTPAETPKSAPPPAATPQSPESPGTAVGSSMPPYSATSLDGKPFELSSTKGKVVLLNVWATWCGPCKGEIPQLQKLHDAMKSRGFEVLGVSVDDAGPDTVREFANGQKITYPLLVDPEGKIATMLQTSVLPTSILLDRNGRIVWREIGAVDTDNAQLKQALEQALGGPAHT